MNDISSKNMNKCHIIFFIDEMTYIPIDSLVNRKRSQLHQSSSMPPFYLDLYDHEWNVDLGTTVYCFEFGIITNDSTVLIYKTKYRFSDLYSINDHLSKQYPAFFKVMNLKFPSKRLFFSNSNCVINERMSMMKRYFSKVTMIENILDDVKFVMMFTMKNRDEYV